MVEGIWAYMGRFYRWTHRYTDKKTDIVTSGMDCQLKIKYSTGNHPPRDTQKEAQTLRRPVWRVKQGIGSRVHCFVKEVDTHLGQSRIGFTC